MNKCKTWIPVLLMAMLLLAFHAPAQSATVVWYVDDGTPDVGGYWWSDAAIGPHWEYMNTGTLGQICRMEDIGISTDPMKWSCTPQHSADYSGYDFWAELWIENGSGTNIITVELRLGTPGNEGALLASQTFVPLVGVGAQKNTVNFGTLPSVVLTNQSLILKIYRIQGINYDIHIHWDDTPCPSALHASNDPQVQDVVVCEPQGNPNPTHPNTYWYDVTPGAFGRCDFHVRVFDPDSTHYTNVVKPGLTWKFQIHKVGSEWWASWWDPGCTNAIFSTTRFSFDHTHPPVWSKWVTTIAGARDPSLDVIDTSDTHTGDVDGYGYRVHVPAVKIPTLSEWGMIILSLLLATAAIVIIRKRRACETR
jgi:hypothetical protein